MGMETQVAYDSATKEFVINSPTVLSQKYWISNGFKHANTALVFGQTLVDGKHEGVNAFLVPVRDNNMQAMPGVTINDMGVKFKDVRIPRVNMMNKHADVSEEGVFSSAVENIQSRFFKVTERLLSGRLCIAAFCSGVTRCALYIAVKYA